MMHDAYNVKTPYVLAMKYVHLSSKPLLPCPQ
jgi:hypothetical protein